MIKLFEDFNSDKDKVIRYLDSIGIHNGYNINDDLSVDVNHRNGVFISGVKLDKLQVKFNKVDKWFILENNDLTTLEGCPIEVGNGFACRDNLITSLEGCPTITNKSSFNIYSNKLTSLVGSPKEVEQMYCDNNLLTNLKGSPEIVNDTFNCSNNDITSLEFGPKSVKSDYSIYNCPIYNLDGFDCKFDGFFFCENTPINKVFPLNGRDYYEVNAFKTYKIINDKKVNFKRLKWMYDSLDLIMIKNLEKVLVKYGYEII
jgi:hypothetical protein